MRKLGVRMVILGLALLVPSLTQAQTHVYTLNGSFSDLYGGPSLTGNSSNLSGSGYTFSGNQGLSLSNVLTGGSYALVFRANFSALTGNDGWAKLVDFKNRSSDNGYYAPGGTADFFVGVGNVATEYTGTAGSYGLGAWTTTVLTRDASTKLFTAYVNGVQQFSFVDTNGDAVFSGPNNVVNLFMDDAVYDQGESPTGTISYLAAYDLSASPGQAASYAEVTSTPEPASVTLLATGLVGIIGLARRRRKKAA